MATKTTLNSLVLIQKRIVRTLSNVGHYEHTAPLFKNLKISKISDIYKLECLIQDQLHRQDVIHLQTASGTHNTTTRHRHNQRPIFPQNELQKSFVTYYGCVQYNALPESGKKT